MYKIRWNAKHNCWTASVDDAKTWDTLKASDSKAVAAAIAEAAKTYGVAASKWTVAPEVV